MWERYRERYRKSILYRSELRIRMGVRKERILGENVPQETKKNRIEKENRKNGLD